MQVSKELWKEKMHNLNERRSYEVIKNTVPGVDDYGLHIRKAFGGVGSNILDVGCGLCIIKNHVSPVTNYVGIDPFPMKEGVIKMEMEDCTFEDNSFDTVYAFAMLDNVYDLKKTLHHIKRVCRKNVLFLTGVNIEPDKYHTLMLTEELLVEEMKPFSVGYKEYFHPKIMLIEFIK